MCTSREEKIYSTTDSDSIINHVYSDFDYTLDTQKVENTYCAIKQISN